MTASIAAPLCAVNVPSSTSTSEVATQLVSLKKTRKRKPRPRKARAFSRDGVQWTPYAMSLMRLKHGIRQVAATFRQVAVEAWQVGGQLHLAWAGLSEACGKAASTVRLHVAHCIRAGLVRLVEQGGGRLHLADGRIVGHANVYEVTDLGWQVARNLAPWPQIAPEEATPREPNAGLNAQPEPIPAPTGASMPGVYLPIVGNHLEREGVEKGTFQPSPTPPCETGAEAGTPEGPAATPDPVAGGPDGPARKRASNAPGGASSSTALRGAQRTNNAKAATSKPMPAGRRWTPVALERHLLRIGAPPAAIPFAVRRALGEGVGAPLRLAEWFCVVEWPRQLAKRAAAQQLAEEKSRDEEAERMRIRAQLERVELANPGERGGCPHGAGPGCRICRDVGKTLTDTLLARCSFKKKPRPNQ